MRSLILLIIGLALGSAGTAILINSLHRGSSYPHGVMAVMAAQMKAIDGSLKQNRCAATDLTPRLQTLRFVANDIEPAFAELQSDAQFGRYASSLRAAADAALTAGPASCPAAQAVMDKLGQACDSCHRDYRN